MVGMCDVRRRKERSPSIYRVERVPSNYVAPAAGSVIAGTPFPTKDGGRFRQLVFCWERGMN